MRSFSQPFSVGMRFKMRYENEDASERRYIRMVNSSIYLLEATRQSYCIFQMVMYDFFFRPAGIIIGSSDSDPKSCGSKWKCLVVCSLLCLTHQICANVGLRGVLRYNLLPLEGSSIE